MSDLIERAPQWHADPANDFTVPRYVEAEDWETGSRRRIQADKEAREAYEASLAPRLLTNEELATTSNTMWNEVARQRRPEDANTMELFQYFQPFDGMDVGGRRFLFSPVFSTEGGRKHAVGYTWMDDGSVAPRLFYKSMSDGFWRVSPEYEVQNGRYSKGETMDYGYVRETRLDDAIEDRLEQLEGDSGTVAYETVDWVLQHFDGARLGATKTYEGEAFSTRIRGFEQCLQFKPGHGFETADGTPARDVIEQIRIPEERLPDFGAAPVESRVRHHELLGPVTVDSYVSRDNIFRWNMAHTPDGKVWINGITSRRAEPVSSYGTDYDVTEGGILDNKPLEYRSQIAGLEEGIDYVATDHPSYVELLVLDRLQPIREFRDATGIQRR